MSEERAYVVRYLDGTGADHCETVVTAGTLRDRFKPKHEPAYVYSVSWQADGKEAAAEDPYAEEHLGDREGSVALDILQRNPSYQLLYVARVTYLAGDTVRAVDLPVRSAGGPEFEPRVDFPEDAVHVFSAKPVRRGGTTTDRGYWTVSNLLQKSVDAFNADRRARLAARAAQGPGVPMTVLKTLDNAVVGRPYRLCAARLSDLRRHFRETAPQNYRLFNSEFLEEADRDEEAGRRTAILDAAIETGFVVLHVPEHETDDDRLRDPDLLDGFMRVLWDDGHRDDEVILKVYRGLSADEKLRLMVVHNSWKTHDLSALFDRGFRMFLWNESGVYVDDRLMGLLRTYFHCGRRHDLFPILMDDPLLIDDLKAMDWLLAYRDGRGRPLHRQILHSVCATIGLDRVRRAGTGRKGVPVDLDRLRLFLDAETRYFDKIHSLSVPGFIDNNIAKNFSPKLGGALALTGRAA